MLELKRAAEEIGFEVQARRGTWDSLNRHLRERACAVLHVDGNHFVGTFPSVGDARVLVADPARGVRDMTASEFRAVYDWNGAMLILTMHHQGQANRP
jgi:ABC-type bacteriocin/lantibiotic exporter with double-glycine peptidase domain